MKSLKVNFCHPVSPMVRLVSKIDPKQNRMLPSVNNPACQYIEIALDQVPDGEWKATVEWEYNGRDYFYEEEFDLQNGDVHLHADLDD